MKGNLKLQLSPRQRKGVIIGASVLVALLILVGITVTIVAKQVIQKKIDKIENERQCSIQYDQLRINHISPFGTAEVKIKDLTVKDNKAQDPFLTLGELQTKVQVWKGFHRTLILKNVEADTIHVYAFKNGKQCNYNFLKGKKTTKKNETDCQKLVDNLLGKLNNYCPQRMRIGEMMIRTDLDSVQVQYALTETTMRDGRFSSKATVREAGQKSERWQLSGNVDKKKRHYEGAVVCQGGAKAKGSLPFLQMLEQLDVHFHEARGALTVLDSHKKKTTCQLSGNIRDLQCQHHYLAEAPVCIDSIGGNLQLVVTKRCIEVDSTSAVKLNRAVVHPYLCYGHDAGKHIVVKIDEKDRDAEPLFASLPSELFQILPQLKVQGKMDYRCLLDCDFGNLDSLKFDFNMVNRQRSIRITEGLGEITRFNEQFEYTFYDHGEPVRTVWVGPNNPYFCASYEIPELLKQAILASEDGAFFVHNGFCKSAMQQALIDDIKAGKMRRGGSTITMQLVKNLFLNRKKVLTRKFEEMLLVWMIEDQHLISKDRMFEIYVNIIEWAPGVIGIGEASEFYFHKRPSELTMPECIYLASLIRAPKHYASTLNPDGTLTEAKRAELEFVADRMVTREFMTESQRAAFNSNIKTVITRAE